MRTVGLRPKPGQRIRVKQAYPYTLPHGLEEGQEVTVQEGEDSGGLFVRGDSGQNFRIPLQCAELEWIYLVEGKWRREQHPLVVAEFRKRIEELESTRENWQSGIKWVNEANLAYARKVVAEAERRASSSPTA